MVYKIKYYKTGILATILPFLFPEGSSIVSADTAEEAIKRFEASNKGYKVYDIKRVI